MLNVWKIQEDQQQQVGITRVVSLARLKLQIQYSNNDTSE